MKSIFEVKILGIVAAVCAFAYLLFSYFNPEKGMDNLAPGERLSLKKNIIVMGVDERPEEYDVGRSDTLFVVMFDTNKKAASLLSVPRDTRVRIKGHGWDKINHAYAYGGRELTQKTTEELLGIKINNYVMVDFKGFVGLVDAIGGVDINVEKNMYYYDEWDGFKIDLKKGMQHMDGKTAIQYVRYRDEEGDIGRIARQQKFVKAVMEKVTSPGIITDLPEIASVVYKNIETDMSLRQLLELAGALKEARGQGLKAEMIPGEPYDNPEDGLNYWVPSIYTTREMVADVLGVPMTGAAKRAMENDASEYAASLPADIRDRVSVDDDDTASVRSGKSVKTDRAQKKESAKSEGRSERKKKSKSKAPVIKDDDEERTEAASRTREREDAEERNSEMRDTEELSKSADETEEKKTSEEDDAEDKRPPSRAAAPVPTVSPSMRGGKGR